MSQNLPQNFARSTRSFASFQTQSVPRKGKNVARGRPGSAVTCEETGEGKRKGDRGGHVPVPVPKHHLMAPLALSVPQRAPGAAWLRAEPPVRVKFSVCSLSDESRLEFQHPDSCHSPAFTPTSCSLKVKLPFTKEGPYLLTS